MADKDWIKEFNERQEARKRRVALYLRLIDASLYEDFSQYAELDEAKYMRLLELKHDMYCPACGESSTFTSYVSDDDQERLKRQEAEELMNITQPQKNKIRASWYSRFSLQMKCARNGHVVEFRFVSDVTHHPLQEGEKRPIWWWTITKIGQHPSLTDFHRSDITRFKESMSKENQRDFVRAINTSAHGFNVAACVYYRRVFERILDETAETSAKELPDGKLAGYESADTAGKIRLLSSELPEFLAENGHLYTLLSKGVHSLTEEECAAEMPIIRECIELILEDQLEKLNRRKRKEKTALMLAQASQRHSGR